MKNNTQLSKFNLSQLGSTQSPPPSLPSQPTTLVNPFQLGYTPPLKNIQRITKSSLILFRPNTRLEQQNRRGRIWKP